MIPRDAFTKVLEEKPFFLSTVGIKVEGILCFALGIFCQRSRLPKLQYDLSFRSHDTSNRQKGDFEARRLIKNDRQQNKWVKKERKKEKRKTDRKKRNNEENIERKK